MLASADQNSRPHFENYAISKMIELEKWAWSRLEDFLM